MGYLSPGQLASFKKGQVLKVEGKYFEPAGVAPGGAYNAQQTPAGRPAFRQIDQPPTDAEVIENTNYFDKGGQVFGNRGFSVQDLISSGSILPKEFFAGGTFNKAAYENVLAGSGVPRTLGTQTIGYESPKPGTLGAMTADQLRKELEGISMNPQPEGARSDANVENLIRGITGGGAARTGAAAFGGASGAPPRPNFVNTLANLRQSTGIQAAEDELLSAKQELGALQDEIAGGVRKIKGERVSSRVIGGKLTQLDKDTADAVSAAEARVRESS